MVQLYFVYDEVCSPVYSSTCSCVDTLVSGSLPPPPRYVQETEPAGQGGAKAKVSSWTSGSRASAGSSDSSSTAAAGGGTCIEKAARLLGLDVDTLTRKVDYSIRRLSTAVDYVPSKRLPFTSPGRAHLLYKSMWNRGRLLVSGSFSPTVRVFETISTEVHSAKYLTDRKRHDSLLSDACHVKYRPQAWSLAHPRAPYYYLKLDFTFAYQQAMLSTDTFQPPHRSNHHP